MELETIFENGHNDEFLEKQSPSWSFGEWKDMSLAEDELFNRYCDPPRPLTPLPADTEREFEDEIEWDEVVSAPLIYSLYVLNLMGDETSSRKEDSSSRTESEGSKKKKKRKKPRSQTKVILRRLPPTMTEGEFIAIMSPLPPYNYFNFCKADRSRGVHERTYVTFNFISELDAHDFIERYHDCVFYDSKGNEYISVCHLAPSQSIPKETEKIDQLAGTMKESTSFKNFMATYEESPETLFAIPVNANGPLTPEMMAEELELRPKHGPASTPLLDYIREANSRPSRHSSLATFKDATFSKKSSMDKMRTIKKLDKRKERRDRERKEKKEKDVKSKKIKPSGRSYGDKKYEQSSNGVREQDSSGPSSKSESIEASTSAKSSNPSITSGSKENGEKMPSEANETRESKFSKDMKPKVYSDKKPRSFKGSEFPGKVKDKTRWSKNSGLRTHYDDRPFDKKPSRSSKPAEKPRRPSVEKEGNIKTSTAEADEGSSGNRSKCNSNDISKPKATSDNKPAESVNKDATENVNPESSAGPSTSSGKKVVIKKVIKKVRKVRTDDNEMPSKSNDENTSIPSSGQKKPASAKKFTSSYKPKEDSRPNSYSKSGGVGNSKDQQGEFAPGKNPVSDKHDSNKEVTASSSSKEKEKRVRKGRPDLQIYRPGSLRSSATSTKPSESNVNESKSSEPPKTEK